MSSDLTHDKFVTVFSSRTHLAVVEAEMIHLMLESAGLQSLVVRENVPLYPFGRVSVRVLESQAAEAEELIREAQTGEGGPEPPDDPPDLQD